jgi:hypothetical protein
VLQDLALTPRLKVTLLFSWVSLRWPQLLCHNNLLQSHITVTSSMLLSAAVQDLVLTPRLKVTLPYSWVSLRWPQLRVNRHQDLQAAVYVEQQPTGDVVDLKLRLYDRVAHLTAGG